MSYATLTDKVERLIDKAGKFNDFWEIYQQNGTRTAYVRGFAGYGFNFDNFYPRYDIEPTNAELLFYNWSKGNVEGSLKARLEAQGVTLDLSRATNVLSAFAYTNFTELPTIDLTGVKTQTAGYIGNIFQYSRKLETVEKLVVSENTKYQAWFAQNSNLANLTIEGTIGQSGFDFTEAKALTHDSLMSILGALKDYSADTATHTLTLGETHLAKLTDAEKAIATERGWTLT